jgi:predicted nucleic acid-binding protein
MTDAIADTTVLNNFAQVRHPRLLRVVLPDLAAPTDVLAELSRGEKLGAVPRSDWSWLQILELTEAERQDARDISRILDPGEAACIAVARSRDLTLLTDDLRARRLARSFGIRVSGTVGILSALVSQGEISLEQADALLADMREHGYRSPVESLKDL